MLPAQVGHVSMVYGSSRPYAGPCCLHSHDIMYPGRRMTGAREPLWVVGGCCAACMTCGAGPQPADDTTIVDGLDEWKHP